MIAATTRVLTLLLILAAGLTACDPGISFVGKAQDPATAAPELAGVNWDGAPFRLQDQRGKVAVIFFGYTFCPDVCPFTLAKMQQIRSRLGDHAQDLAVVFVSVDPHRDSLEKLASYVPNFDSSFYGLRLEFDELDTVIEDWDLTVQYGQPKEGPGTDSFYYVDHTGTYFLVDQQGRLRVEHPPNAKTEDLLSDLQTLLVIGGQAR